MWLQIRNEVARTWRRYVQEPWRRGRAARDFQWLHGPFPAGLGPTDLVVVCLARDAQIHVETFLEHHFSLGAAHVVLMDNGSSDATLDLATRYDRTTVLQTNLNFTHYQQAIRQFLVDRFGRNCWCLVADIDERFDYPASSRIALGSFLEYLNERRFSAVVCQMLDLFADGPASTWPRDGRELRQQCAWYDPNGLLRAQDFGGKRNRFSDPAMCAYHGGIRRTSFNMSIAPCLTKLPLLFRSRGAIVSPTSAHECGNGFVADVSCLLAHYKFHGDFVEQCQRAVRLKNHWQDSVEYEQYLAALRERPELVLKGPGARRFRGADVLVDEGFLVMSGSYRNYVARRGREPRQRVA